MKTQLLRAWLTGALAACCLASASAVTAAVPVGSVPAAGAERTIGEVDAQVRFHVPGVESVDLLWRPSYVQFGDKSLRRAPMHRDGDTFSVALRAPAGTEIEYGFWITRVRGYRVGLWIGNDGDPSTGLYRTIVAGREAAEVTAGAEALRTIAMEHRIRWMWRLQLLVVFAGGALLALLVRGQRRGGNDDARARSRATLAQVATLAACIAVGLALRIVDAHEWNEREPPSATRLHGDEVGYNAIATAILHGSPLVWPGRVPLYPAWLAAGRFLARSLGVNPFALLPYLQTLLGAATILLTYLMCARVFSRWTAIAAAFIVAVCIPLVRQTEPLLSEALYTPVVVMLAIALIDAFERSSFVNVAWVGYWLGVSDLVRPTLLLFPIALCAAWVCARGWRAGLRCGFVCGAVAVAVTAPWIAHNTLRHHRLIPLASSNAFYYFASPEYYHYVRDERYEYNRVWDEVLHAPGHPERDFNTIVGDSYWRERAWRSIRSQPLTYAHYAAERLLTYWVGDPDIDWGGGPVLSWHRLRSWGYGPVLAAATLLFRVFPLVALAAAGMLWRQARRRLLPMYALVGYCIVLHAAVHAEARLSEPLLPVLAMFFVGAAEIVVTRAHARAASPAAPAVSG